MEDHIGPDGSFTSDWRSTTACALLQTIRRTAIQNLPGYDAAPWGIGDPVELRPAFA